MYWAPLDRLYVMKISSFFGHTLSLFVILVTVFGDFSIQRKKIEKRVRTVAKNITNLDNLMSQSGWFSYNLHTDIFLLLEGCFHILALNVATTCENAVNWFAQFPWMFSLGLYKYLFIWIGKIDTVVVSGHFYNRSLAVVKIMQQIRTQLRNLC